MNPNSSISFSTKDIIIVDDHPLFMEGLEQLICADQRLKVVAKLQDGHQLLAALAQNTPDLIILDVQMPIMDGITVARLVKKDFPHIKILMLTQHDEQPYILRLICMGVDGYILKKNTLETLSSALETILFQENKKYFPDEVWKILRTAKGNKEEEQTPRFTNRELQIIQLICDGIKTEDIARTIFLSIPAVEKIRSDIFIKTGVKNMAQLVAYAFRNNLCT